MTVYGKIEKGILSPAPYGKIDELFAKGFSPFDDDLFSQCICGMITANELIEKQESLAKKSNLQSKINELDIKSIRAMREGGIYDATTGQTWVEYLTEQIKLLRAQIAEL